MNLLKSIKKRLFRRPTPAAKVVKLDSYDDQLSLVMRRVLQKNSNCVDVGCHRGAILKEMVEIAPQGRHHAFEALPDLAGKLNFPTAVIHTCAVADKAGTAEFQHVENAPAYSGLRERIYDRADPKITKIKVRVTTLDEAIPASLPIKLVKLDIEGGEYHALRGAMNLIRRCRPFLAFEAGHKSTGQYGVTAEQMYDLVSSLDYDVTTMKRWLDGESPISREKFVDNWMNGPDYFWWAIPAVQH